MRAARSLACALPLAFALLLAAGVHGEPLQVGPGYFGPTSHLVNFDTSPGGTQIPNHAVLGSIYAEWGVTFGANDGVTNWPNIGTSLPNMAWGSSDGLEPIDCLFPSGVYAVGAYGFDFALEAFDSEGGLIYRVAYTDGTAGLYSPNEIGFLGIASDVPIHHARFSRYWSAQWAFGFEIDDLRFTTEQPVPTRSTTWGRIKSLYR